MRLKRTLSLPKFVYFLFAKRRGVALALLLAAIGISGLFAANRVGAAEISSGMFSSIGTQTSNIFALIPGGSVSTTPQQSTGPAPMTSAPRTNVAMFACTAPPIGINTWYKGENSAEDFQGLLNATLENGVLFAGGKVGQAFSFDGSNDSVLIPSQNLGNSYTIEFWINPNGNTPSGLNHLVSNFFGSTSFGALYIANNLSLQYWQAGTPKITTAPNSIVVNGWSHVAISRDNTDGLTRIYINGSLAGTSSSSFAATFNNQVRLGFAFSPSDSLYKGLLDEVSFYNTTLTLSDIQSISNAGIDGKCPPAGLQLLPTTVSVNRNAGLTLTALSGTPPYTFSIPTNNSGGSINPTTGAYVSGPSLGVDTLRVTDAAAATDDTIVTVTVLCTPGQKTWDGGGVTNNWSEAANWSCDQVPLTSDSVIFDSASSKSVTINTNVTVVNFNINTGYAGTITQGSSSLAVTTAFTQNAGTLTGGNAAMTIETFALTAGTFTATSGTLAVRQGFTVNSGATFLHNNGTLDGGFSFSFLGTATSLDLNNFTISFITNLTSRTFNVAGTLSFTGVVARFATGTINAFGNVTGVVGGASAGTLNIVGNAVRTITFPAGTAMPITVVDAPNVTINTSGNTPSSISTLDIRHATSITNGDAPWNVGTMIVDGPFTQGVGSLISGGLFQMRTNGNFLGSSAPISVNQATIDGGLFTGGSGNLTFGFDYIQNGGEFHLGSGTVNFNRLVFVHGGTLVASSGTTRINNNTFSVDRTAGFDANGGLVRIPTGTSLTSSIDHSVTFNNLIFESGQFGVSDMNVNVLGDFNMLSGQINGTSFTSFLVRGNVTIGASVLGLSTALQFTGPRNQTYTNDTFPIKDFLEYDVDKSGGIVTAATSMKALLSGAVFIKDISINGGTLYLNPGVGLGARKILISPTGKLICDSSTTIQVGVELINDGVVDLQGSGAGCPESDTIQVLSFGPSPTWSGSGIERLVDVLISGISGDRPRNMYSSQAIASPNFIANAGCQTTPGISPAVAEKAVGQTQTFTAGGGFTPYVFSLTANNSGGSVDASSGLYTAGTTPNVTDTVRVTDAFGGTADATVNVVSGPPTKLGITIQPSNTLAGQSISPSVQVAIQRADGSTAISATDPVTIAILNNAGGGTLSGTLTRNAENGIATFNKLNINKAGIGYTLRTTSGSLTAADSNGFNIIPGVAHHLIFTAQPSNAVDDVDITPPIIVEARDQNDNLATSFGNVINLSIGNNPLCPANCATIVGGATVANNGIATFSNLRLRGAGNGVTLIASSFGSPVLINATSDPFNLSGPTQLAFSVQPTSTFPGAPIAPDVKVEVRDQNGVVFTNATNAITLAIGNNPSGGTLSGSTFGNAVAGVATFSGLRINNAGNGYTLNATAFDFPQVTSSAFDIISPFVVKNTNDSGAGSLRNAITTANTTPGIQTISFNMPGTAPFTIVAATGLPSITEPLIIDGTSQPGFAGSPVIEIDGSSTIKEAGFNITGGGSTIRGLVINRFLIGIAIDTGTGNVIAGNYIGTDTAGALSRPNSVGIFVQSDNNVIGGTAVADRNVISGNLTAGLSIRGSNNSVKGNFIGRNASNTSSVANQIGILITISRKLLVTGTPVTTAIAGNTIGGTEPGAANIIGQNTQYGISISTSSLQNRGNLIRGNIILDSETTLGHKPISLTGTTTPLANDPRDPDTGANDRQNRPDITSADATSGQLTVNGSLDSAPNRTYTLEFYSHPNCLRARSFGGTPIGTLNITANANPRTPFTFSVPQPAGTCISATATDPDNNTSEFSTAVHMLPKATISGRLTVAGIPLANSQVRLGGNRVRIPGIFVTTNSNGEYSIDHLPIGFDFDVVPVDPRFSFVPDHRDYPALSSDQMNQDFAGTARVTISGQTTSTVGSSTTALSGVEMTLSGGASATATTDINGNYTFNNLTTGTYLVTPSKPNFTFSPPSRSFTGSTAQIANFAATLNPPLAGRMVEQTGSSLFVMSPDGSGKTKIFDIGRTGSCYDSSPSISADGRKLAFSCVRNSAQPNPFSYDLYTSDYDGSNRNIVSSGGAARVNGHDPEWSPNGQKIAFVKVVANVSSLITMNDDGTNTSTVFTAPAGRSVRSPSWSADALQIAFRGNDNSGQEQIFITNTDGTGLTQLTTDDTRKEGPYFSPDGTKILLIRKIGQVGSGTAWTVNPNGPGQTQIGSGTDFRELAWSPDGARIGFSTGSIARGVMNADGSNQIIFGRDLVSSWGADPTLQTPIGTDVNVNIGSTSVTFNTVSAGGTTSIVPIPPNSAGTVPGGYSVGSFGAFEISTTATVTPPITACFTVPSTVSLSIFNTIRIMHNEGGILVDRTVLFPAIPSPDFATKTVCSLTTSLSPFVIAEQIDPALPRISGLVTDENGFPLGDVEINLAGTDDRTTTTDSNGYYMFPNLTAGGSYNIEPRKAGYLFSDSSEDRDNLTGENMVAFAGTATTVTIAGKVVDGNGNGAGGIFVDLTGGDTRTAVTNANGDYSFAGLPADVDFNVTAFDGIHTFSPTHAILDRLNGDIADIDFSFLVPSAANVSISGRVVTTDGQGIRNARITLTDAGGYRRTALTAAFGYYRFDEVEVGGTYVVSIASKRFTFFAPTRIISVSDELTDIDFEGEPLP
ncbi:hypothetical protein BH10ACI3_BH10ACI3_16850 [soil metagenome]